MSSEKEKNIDKLGMYFLQLLRTNSEVRDEIRKICLSDDKSFKEEREKLNVLLKSKDDTIGDLEVLTEKLKNEISAYKEKISDMEFQNKIVLNSKEKIIKELTSEKNNLTNELFGYEQKIEEYGQLDDLMKYYRLYLSLDDEIKKKLKNTLSAENAEYFISCGVQFENIENLWSFIANYFDSFNQDTTVSIISVFEYLFNCYRLTDTTYELLAPKKGDEFDEDSHSRASGSAISGIITEVFLAGYRNRRTGQIIKKSIVRV